MKRQTRRQRRAGTSSLDKGCVHETTDDSSSNARRQSQRPVSNSSTVGHGLQNRNQEQENCKRNRLGMPPQLVVADDRYGNRDEYREHSSGRGSKPIAPALSRGRGRRWWLSIHDCREVRSGYLFGT